MMQICRLTASEAKPYRALMLDAYAAHPDAFTSTVEERMALPMSWWAARLSSLSNAQEVVFGAFIDGRLLGVVGIAYEERAKTRHKASIFGMYVATAARKTGLGRALLQAALEDATQRQDILLVQLTVSEGNTAAIALYECCQFLPYGLEPFAIRVGDEFVAKIQMWRPISHKESIEC